MFKLLDINLDQSYKQFTNIKLIERNLVSKLLPYINDHWTYFFIIQRLKNGSIYMDDKNYRLLPLNCFITNETTDTLEMMKYRYNDHINFIINSIWYKKIITKDDDISLSGELALGSIPVEDLDKLSAINVLLRKVKGDINYGFHLMNLLEKIFNNTNSNLNPENKDSRVFINNYDEII